MSVFRNPLAAALLALGAAGTPSSAQDVEVSFSVEPGWYADPVDVALSSDDGYEIRYTLDGSNPTADSPLYTAPLDLGDRFGDPNVFAAINPTPRSTFRPPEDELMKINVVKARAFDADGPAGPVRFNSYMIDPDGAARYGVHVVSLALEPDDLFGGEDGIYVTGDAYTGSASTANYNQRGRDWERRGSLQLFDEAARLQLDQDVGVRTHGGSTRAFIQKSLRLYARDDYGPDKLEYPFFDNRDFDGYKRILLRQTNSTGLSLFREPMAHELISAETDVGVMEALPAVVFLNGEYWGVYQIRDRLDDRYVEYRFGVDRKKIDYWEDYPGRASNVEEGTNDAYLALEAFLIDPSTDLAGDEDYAVFAAAVDVPSFIDYIIAETYFANRDWPDNNVEMWRDQNGGKIRFLFKDLDLAMLSPRFDSLYQLADPDAYFAWPVSVTPALFFSRAIENAGFVAAFLERYEHHLNNTFAMTRVNAAVAERVEQYVGVFAEHWARFNRSVSERFWRRHSSDYTLAFFEQRRCVVRTQLLDLFGTAIDVPGCATGTVSVVLDEDIGGVVNSADGGIRCGTACTATYADGTQVALSAVSGAGIQFDGWLGCSVADGATCTVFAAEAGVQVTARFSRVGTPPGELIVDDTGAALTGNWPASSGADPYGAGSLYSTSASHVARFAAALAEAGNYEVYAWWTYHPNRASSVPYRIIHADGHSEVLVNQRNQPDGGQWNRLGVYRFSGDAAAVVELLGRNGQASADAIRFVPTDEEPPPPVVQVVMDNGDAGTSSTGEWKRSSGVSPYGSHSVYSANADATDTYRWTPALPEPGRYAVSVWWTYHRNRSTSVPYQVVHDAGTTEVAVNQLDRNAGGRWQPLGEFELGGAVQGYVEVSGVNGQASADAVRFTRVP